MVQSTGSIHQQSAQSATLSPATKARAMEMYSAPERPAGKTAAPRGERSVQSAVDELNSALDSLNVKRQYRVDDDLNQVVVKIISPDDNKIVKQIPTEKALDLSKNIRSMVGLLFDEVA